MRIQTFRDRQRWDGLRAKLLHAGGDQFGEQVQLEPVPGRSDFGAHLQRIPRHIRQVMTFVQHQQ